MTEYRVSWVIDVDAEDAVEAAWKAFEIMQTPKDPTDRGAAVVFDVWKSFDADPMDAVTVDLSDTERAALLRDEDRKALFVDRQDLQWLMLAFDGWRLWRGPTHPIPTEAEVLRGDVADMLDTFHRDEEDR